ncbi:hypothetical protein NW752_001799 [Fusarium irregulare]|uniref:Uncharacterized protein n=1 Tax=Fusarium irregulare TaxID=2494466 RepID=A0A9W8PUB1_9HYPO|nr:hypothetical protein NW766_003963 [Fusarium irregulare]KAJ4026842.1 hypothetical protein NW752_001799 [Fusarium irregulare]
MEWKAQQMIQMLGSSCNIKGEKAGLGEHLKPLQVIYWLAHRLCRQIQRVTSANPTATQDETAFALLDRWGLPVVPWTCHALEASLCHGPDHGIAMKLGVINVGEADFDPLVHFDFRQCTVEFETITTNLGMWNWLPEDWGSARSMLLDIPINHAFWKLNPSMGYKFWVDTGTISNVTPEPPVANFDMPFLPSSLCVSNGA